MRQLSNLAFSFTVDGVIWKTVLDQRTGRLALEIRDQEQLVNSFAVLDIPKQSLGDAFQIAEADWWSSLQLIHQDYLFIEKYQDPQNPIDKALIIANSEDGELIKHYPGHQLIDIQGEKVIYQKIEDPVGPLELELPATSRLSGLHKFMEPMVYVEGSDNFEVVKAFLADENIVSLVDYAESGDYVFISYLILEGETHCRKLMVLNGEEVVYHATLDKNVEGISPGAFFVFNNYLIFIVERKEINALEL